MSSVKYLLVLLLLAAPLEAATVTMTWDAGSALPVQTYNIYRGSLPDCSDCVKINPAPIAGLNYADPSAIAGNVYYYSLTAVVGVMETKKGSLVAKADLTQMPVAPTNFKIPLIILP